MLQRCSTRVLSALLMATGLGLLCGLSAQSSQNPEDNLSWDILASEADAFLSWTEDPFAELDLPTPEPSWWVHSGSIRAGIGQSTNYLKRKTPVPKDFSQLEGDFFINLLLGRSSLTALFFGEYTEYVDSGEANAESLGFGLLEWSLPAEWGTYGIRTTFFYGDQIYDASLTVQAPPVGATFRQFRPEAGLFFKRNISSIDTLEGTLSARKAIFDDPENDYERAEIHLQWMRKWSRTWTTETAVKGFTERHRNTLSRTANGDRLNPETALRIHGAEFEQSIGGKLFQDNLRWSLAAEASIEIDAYGSYEDLYRTGSSFQLSWKRKRLALEGIARWQATHYDQRQVAYLDPTALQRCYRTAEFKGEFQIFKGFSLQGRVEWLKADSDLDSERYSERRTDLLLNWSY